MTRKVIQINPSTLAITIPKGWAKKKNIKKGDELAVNETPKGDLNISSGKGIIKKAITIKLKKEKQNILRSYISALYRMGYNEIEVEFKDKEVLKELQLGIESFYDLDIFDIKKDSCVLRSIFKEDSADIKSHIMKAVHIINTMFNTIIEDLEKTRFISKQQLSEFEQTCHKQRDLIHRKIAITNSIDFEVFPYYQISNNLSLIAKSLRKMYFALKSSKKYNLDILLDVKSLFQNLFRSIEEEFNYQLHDSEMKITEKIDQKINISIIDAYCLRIIPDIQNCNAPISMLHTSKND